MAVAKFGGIPGPRGARGPAGPVGAVLGGISVADYGALGTHGADATTAVQRAANTGAAHIYFPPGTYDLGAVTFSTADQAVTFAPGAVVRLTAASALVFSGARQRVIGLEVTVSTASETSATLVTVSGASARVDAVQFNVNADVPNVTLLKVQGARTTVTDYKLVGQGKSFKYGVHVVKADAGQVDTVVLQGLDIDVSDDGANCTYGALVYLRALRSQVNDIAFDGGLYALFPDGLVIIDGVKNAMATPKLFAWNATYGVNRLNNSEFFRIIGGHIQGRNNGSYVAGSLGVRSAGGVGASGHLKMLDVSVTGWENGVGLLGSHDTPTFVGCAIVNNQQYAFLIDGGLARGMAITGCYLADVYGEGCIWFKSGLVEGCVISACEIGYQEIGFYAEDTFGTLEGMVVQGCLLVGGLEGATATATMRPGLVSSDVLFINNKRQSAGTLGTGPYAAKAIDLMTAPVFTGATIGATGLKLGTDGNAITKHLSQSNTANYASGVAAGATVTLTFTFTGVLTTDSLHITLPGTHATSGLIYTPYVTTANEVGLRAYNPTASPIGATTGGVRFDVFRH